MKRSSPQFAREEKILRAVIDIYCRSHHSDDDTPCGHCGELLEYALQRLEGCPFGEDKPTCRQCPVHCYRKDMREEIRKVMRYSGPRLMRSHPVLAVRHLVRDRKGASDLRPHSKDAGPRADDDG